VISNEQLSGFIRSSFRSVWSLELLLLLKRNRRQWLREEIVTALRASDLVVAQSLDSLTAGGLLSVDSTGHASYSPATADIGVMADEAEAYYGRSPDAVRRLIVGAASGGSIAAFADAFRLRKD
jgi:hypothetical protein